MSYGQPLKLEAIQGKFNQLLFFKNFVWRHDPRKSTVQILATSLPVPDNIVAKKMGHVWFPFSGQNGKRKLLHLISEQ